MGKFLKTQAEITKYLGGMAVEKWKALAEDKGFPASLIGNTWCAHTDNIDVWMRWYTLPKAAREKDELKPSWMVTANEPGP